MFVKVPEDEKDTLSEPDPSNIVPVMLKLPVMVGIVPQDLY
jgi:hypothetical protein